ncbi:MAG: hypothetical protein ACR2LR_19350 [Hassallia sp.]
MIQPLPIAWLPATRSVNNDDAIKQTACQVHGRQGEKNSCVLTKKSNVTRTVCQLDCPLFFAMVENRPFGRSPKLKNAFLTLHIHFSTSTKRYRRILRTTNKSLQRHSPRRGEIIRKGQYHVC